MIFSIRAHRRQTAMSAMTHLKRLSAAAILAVALTSCGETPTQPATPEPPPEQPKGRLAVFANMTDGTTSLVITVRGPGIVKADGTTPDTLVFNIAISGSTASGSILVPAGAARVVTARAYSSLVETHRGSITTDIVEGTNPTLNISMVPLAGTAPITVAFGTTLVIVSPAVATLAIGDTLRMSAEVRGSDGSVVPGAVARWASLLPGRATVDTLGLVTMRDTGEVQIVATYGTVGGSARLTGRTAVSARSYQLTWNGSVDRDWTRVNNWTPHGIGAARVPTATDSVVIPAGPANQPRMDTCSDANVAHIDLELGASLGSSCGYAINVYGSVVSRGDLSARIYLRAGARISGIFDYLRVFGDSARLIDSARVQTLEINGTGAQLRLNGKRLRVLGSLNIYDGTMRIAAGDTLYAEGNVYWAGSDQTDLITGGVVFFRGTSFYGYRYHANGTNRLVFDRTASGQQSLEGFDYRSAPSRAIIRKLDVRSKDGMSFCSYPQVTDSMTVTSIGSPSAITSCSSYYFRVDGPLITTANTSLAGYLWDLRHVSGTSNIGGTWSPTNTDINVADAVIKPGLNYNHIQFYQRGQFSGPTTLTGELAMDGSTVRVSLNGQTVSAQSLDVRNGALLVMQDPADQLNIAEQAEFHDNVFAAQEPLLSAGVLRVGGRFYGNGFSASGTHKTILTGTSSSTKYVQGLNYETSGRLEQGFRHLEVSGVYGTCDRIRVKLTLLVRSGGALNSSVCGGAYLRIDGDITTETGSDVSPYLVAIHGVNGTNGVSGTWSPLYTDFNVNDAKIKGGLAYQHLRVFARTALLGPTTATGELWVDGALAKLTFGGNRLNAASVDVRNGALLEMTNVDGKDSLIVAEEVEFHHDNHSVQGPLMSAGVIRVGGRFYGHGFSATGTHKVVLAGTSASTKYVHGMNYESRSAQAFRRLEVIGTYSMCERVRADTVHVSGTGVINEATCGGGYLRADTDLRTDAGSTLAPYNVALFNATGTQNVLGTYSPQWTSIHSAPAAGSLRGTLAYQHVAIYAAVSLVDSLITAGDLYLNGTGVNLTLAGRKVRVGGRLNLDGNATITMTNAADSLILNGNDTYWDSGDHNGKLTNGTLIVNVGYFYAPSFYASGNFKTVFSRTTDLTRVAGLSSADPGPQPFRNVEVKNQGIKLESYMYVNGKFVLRSGARVEGGSTLWVVDTLFTETGSAITNGTGSLSVVFKDSSGTSQVNGSFDPAGTYFTAVRSHIKPTLAYRYMRIDRSTTLIGNTLVNGQLDLINDGTVVDLGGRTLEVRGRLDLHNTATFRMSNALDTLKVATGDPNEDIYWDGGTKPSGQLTNGAIVFYGDRFYGTNFEVTGAGTPHRVIFASSFTTGSPVTIEGTPTFGNVEFSGMRTASVNNRMVVRDTLKISVPMTLQGFDYVHVMNGGKVHTVAGSTISMPSFYVDDPTGLKFALGNFMSTNTTYFRASSGVAGAIKPNGNYNSIQVEGDYQLDSAMTIATDFTVDGTAALLRMNGKRLKVGRNMEVGSGGRIQMTNASDTVMTGGRFRLQSGSGASTITDGVIIVKGDFHLDRPATSLTGANKLVLADSSSTSNQYIYTSGTDRRLANVDIMGTRTVQLYYGVNVDGAFRILAPVAVGGGNSTFTGPFSSVAGSSVEVNAVMEFAHPSGTSLINGSFSNSTGGTTRLSSGGTLKLGAGFSYRHLQLGGGAITLSGSPFAPSGNITLLDATASLTVPNGTTIPGSVDTYGAVTFAGSFTSTSSLTVRPGGSATAPNVSSSVWAQFQTIHYISGSTLDNAAGRPGGCSGGFRYASSLFTGGTLIGPSPVSTTTCP
jgi:hypothetical protein